MIEELAEMGVGEDNAANDGETIGDEKDRSSLVITRRAAYRICLE